MELKLFGKSVFEFKTAKSSAMMAGGNSAIKDSKYLLDFYTLRDIRSLNDFISFPSNEPAKPEKKYDKKLTPKNVYEMKTLNDASFKLNVDPSYVESQLADFKDKLNMTKDDSVMAVGNNEIGSIIQRLENRKLYPKYQSFFDQFAYTFTAKINDLVKEHDYLKLGLASQFVADMPKEATQVMKDYDAKTQELCGKKAVFYIIADKKDFEKTNKRRDPILLAQSPFAHAWQILGAWDKEMLFLEEL